MTTTRQAFHVTTRSMITGAEWRMVIWSKDASCARGRAALAAARGYKHGVAHMRTIECRDATTLEIAAHYLRLVHVGAISAEEAADKLARLQ